MKENSVFYIRVIFTIFLINFIPSFLSCKGSESIEDLPKEKEILPIELLTPINDIYIDLNYDQEIYFEWKAIDGINTYELLLSVDTDFNNSVSIIATENPLKITSRYLDERVSTGLGLESDAIVDLYWKINGRGNIEAKSHFRKIRLATKIKHNGELPYVERIAETTVVNVAVVYEDPIVPNSGGKRLHEVATTPGYSFRWNNPRQQSKEYEALLEEVSNGVIDYVITHEFEADQFFSRHTHNSEYLTLEEVLEIFEVGPIPGIGEGIDYDYIGMVNHFNIGEMRDNGEIHEIWVYTHPASGMYESRLMGQGAFWLNSPGIDFGAPNRDLLTIMFCNYERGIESALHSYGHRVESIMNQVYGGWKYDSKSTKSDLTNWERFCGYKLNYDKFDSGYSNIGLIHFPPNGVKDYDYGNRSYINTYADEWINYPNIKEIESRTVNCQEWNCTELGFMKWWLGHLPHFKGLNSNPSDLHLNNWWYYIVDYNAALRYERELQIGKKYK